MAITKNIVTDYGCDPTGVADTSAILWLNLNPDMQGVDADITFPAGTYNWASSFAALRWINGVGTLNVYANGSTNTGEPFLQTSHIGQIGIDATAQTPSGFSTAGGKSARIQTVNRGSNSVTLTAASASAGHISRFAVNQYIMVCGWSIQGTFQSPFSFPPNFQWNEFRKITSIVGNTISFTEPLAYYYSANWPEINRGSEFEVDAAGPATIFALSLFWNGDTNINDGIWTRSNLINCYRENFTITGGTSGGLPVYPSVTKLYRATNHTATASLTEHDKLNELVDLQGGSYSNWKCQSSSTKTLTMTGVSLGILGGTVKNTVLDSCTISATTNATIGPTAYGRGETFVATNCTFNGGVVGGLFEKGPSNNLASEVGVQGYMFKNGSVITMPYCLSESVTRTTMPDANGRYALWWYGNFGAMGSFRALSVTSDRWPATDDASVTVGCTMANGSQTLVTDTPTFVPGDVGKTVLIGGIRQANSFINCTITNANPAVITQNGHSRVVNEPIQFRASGGVLPTGITAATTYYIISTTTNTFQVSATQGGAAVDTTGGGGSGTVQGSTAGSNSTFITGYVNSTTVTLFHGNSYFGQTSVSKTLRYGTCNLYIQTDNADPLPAASTYNSLGKLWLVAPPVYSVRFENCTGTEQVVDLSQPAAWNRPLDSYTKRQYRALPQAASNGHRLSEAGALAGTGSRVPMVGAIQSIKFNVTKAYTGVQGTLTAGLSQSQIQLMINGAWTSYAPRINMKILGERVITPSGVTGTQSGDSNLTLGSLPAWIGGGFDPSMSVSISGEAESTWPEFTIEMITDQGFSTGPVAVVPLRLRLRAA
jgi:hypothetical protein